MRLIVALLASLSFGTSANASVPVAPPPGSSFTTSDKKVTFRAEPDAQGRELVFVFSRAPDVAAGGFTFPGEPSQTLDMGWLALKFDHIGTFYWWVCPALGENFDPVIAECSQPWDFAVAFRLQTVTRAAAKASARYVMQKRFRGFWRGFSGRTVSCSRVTRTRQRCRVSGFAGDSVLAGRITIRDRRYRGHAWSLHWYTARVRLVNEYCAVVLDRPLRECTTIRRKSGWVY